MLYIMRHGVTDWNIPKKLQGCHDIPLNETGRDAARRAGILCQNVHFDLCFSSPMKRARETAELVLAGRDVPILFDDRLVEISFGVAEGMRLAELEESSPAFILFHSPERYEGIPEGESFPEVFARVGSFLDGTLAPEIKMGKDVLIIAHGVVNNCITTLLHRRTLAQFWAQGIENCKLYSLPTDYFESPGKTDFLSGQ